MVKTIKPVGKQPQQKKHEKHDTKHIIIKLHNGSDKEKTKAARENQVTQRRTNIRITVGFLLKTTRRYC